MTYHKRTELKRAAAGLAVLLLAAAVLTGAAAAADADGNHSVTIATDVPPGWITASTYSAEKDVTITVTVNSAAVGYLIDGTLKYTPSGDEAKPIQKDVSGNY